MTQHAFYIQKCTSGESRILIDANNTMNCGCIAINGCASKYITWQCLYTGLMFKMDIYTFRCTCWHWSSIKSTKLGNVHDWSPSAMTDGLRNWHVLNIHLKSIITPNLTFCKKSNWQLRNETRPLHPLWHFSDTIGFANMGFKPF